MRASGKSIWFVCLAAAMVFSATQARALEIVSLPPGESTVRDIVLFDEFNPRRLKPIETFAVISAGDNTTKVGDLTITLKPTITKDFGSVLDYRILGIAYALGGKAAVISMTATAPLTLTKVVKMNALYGFVLFGVYISDIEGDVNLPLQMNITLIWAVAK